LRDHQNIIPAKGVLKELVEDSQKVIDGLGGQADRQLVAKIFDVPRPDVSHREVLKKGGEVIPAIFAQSLEVAFGDMAALFLQGAPLYPGAIVIGEPEVADFPGGIVLRVELPQVYLVPHGGQETVGPLPGIQGVAVLAGIELYGLRLPMEMNIIAPGSGQADRAGQGFPLELALAFGACLFRADPAHHAQFPLRVREIIIGMGGAQGQGRFLNSGNPA